jgi:hypothetical protein
MFSSPNNMIMISGILLALTFICGLLYYVNKMFANNTQDILVRFILLVFTALVGVWVVDKVIAFKIKLLDAEQGAQLFDLIKTLILMIFSYYFGSKKGNESKN